MGIEELTPLEAAILVAISRGLTDPKLIANLVRVSEDEVRSILERLENKGLIRVEERRILFFKRRRIVLTEKGYNVLPKAIEIVSRIAEALQKAQEQGVKEKKEVEEATGVAYEELTMVTPILLWLGLVPTLTLLEAAAFSELIEAETALEEHLHEEHQS